MVIARLLGHHAINQVPCRLKIAQAHHGLQQVGLHPLPFARGFPLQQGNQNTHGGKHTGARVGNGNTGAHGPLTRQAGDRHQASHALGNLVKPGAGAVRPVFSKAGNAGQDDARVDLGQRLVVNTQPKLDIRPKVLDHHVGVLNQLEKNLLGLRLLEVEGDRPLVAVQVDHVVGVSAAQAALVGVHPRRGFNAKHIGTKIGKYPHTSGSRTHAGQV